MILIQVFTKWCIEIAQKSSSKAEVSKFAPLSWYSQKEKEIIKMIEREIQELCI